MINSRLYITVFFIFPFLLLELPIKVSAESLTFDESIARKIIEKYGQSIFTVNAFTKLPGDDTQNRRTNNAGNRWSQNVGTAFLFDNNGHLITFNCILKNAEKIQVISNAGRKIQAKVLESGKNGKINILKISHGNLLSIPRIMPFRNHDSDKEIVLLGINGSSITAIPGRIIDIHPPDGTVVVTVSGFPGTTGTPVFNKNGHLFGFLVCKIEKDDNENNNVSTPRAVSETDSYVVLLAEFAWATARSIINRDECKCGWLGIASDFRSSNPSGGNGVIVKSVYKNSPADNSGLAIDDEIIEFNANRITSFLELIEAITRTKPGDTVSISVRRGSKIISSNITLSVHPKTN